MNQTIKRPAADFSNDESDDEYDVSWGEKRFKVEVANECDYLSESSYQSCTTCKLYHNSSSQSDNTESEITNNTDIQETTEPNLLFPVCFKTCLQCHKENPNPLFQYCNNCFNYRKQLFESNQHKPKFLRKIIHKNSQESNSKLSQELCASYSQKSCITNSQESCATSSQESGSFGISGLYLSQNSVSDINRDTAESCNICFLKPKNGIFNHGKTSHIYCCYTCAKHVWSKTGKCPICNLKIRYVTKGVIV